MDLLVRQTNPCGHTIHAGHGMFSLENRDDAQRGGHIPGLRGDEGHQATEARWWHFTSRCQQATIFKVKGAM